MKNRDQEDYIIYKTVNEIEDIVKNQIKDQLSYDSVSIILLKGENNQVHARVFDISQRREILTEGIRPEEIVPIFIQNKFGITTNAYCTFVTNDLIAISVSRSYWFRAEATITAFQNFILSSTPVPDFSGSFADKVFETIHSFQFFCRQHPESLHDQDEPLIRDIFLLTLKLVFKQAEGEAFNYDGRVDFKVTNRDNYLEFITGEFKWWDGKATFENAFNQAVRKHFTGQEKEVYIIMLSKLKDSSIVKREIERLVFNEDEIDKSFESKNLAPLGSYEFFKEYRIITSERFIPLKVGVINLHYQRV
ncbi:hypothetical protein [Dendrosporobacter sp. 1207_IL3150]|uniref:hypothetical protein n=1 Tax=Dendrosporobacter sp. 1207_IL3150 TaxID=3084054 RepID=UPI002FD9BBC2